MFVCGIDGGGTKTEIKICDIHGYEIAHWWDDGINISGKTKEQIQVVLNRILDRIQESCGKLDFCSVICAGIAGISCSLTKYLWEKTFESKGYNGKLVIIGDQEIALWGAHQKGEGIILISGTGSICFGDDGQGNTHRSGGYGHLIDDEGSGYDIGRQALSAIVKSGDHRIGDTSLKGLVYSYLNISGIEDLIAYIYARERVKKDIAAIAPLVFKASVTGDAVAVEILNLCSEKLTDMVEATVKTLGMESGDLAMLGSILTKTDVLRNITETNIRNRLPQLKISSAKLSSVDGAVLMAKQYLKGVYI